MLEKYDQFNIEMRTKIFKCINERTKNLIKKEKSFSYVFYYKQN